MSLVASSRLGSISFSWSLKLYLGNGQSIDFYPHNLILFAPLGRLSDVYGDFKYTFWACGVILLVAGVYLFISMGIYYRLLARERQAEKQLSKERKEEALKEVIETAESVEQNGSEDPTEERLPV